MRRRGALRDLRITVRSSAPIDRRDPGHRTLHGRALEIARQDRNAPACLQSITLAVHWP
jgi:hypothetical protein